MRKRHGHRAAARLLAGEVTTIRRTALSMAIAAALPVASVNAFAASTDTASTDTNQKAVSTSKATKQKKDKKDSPMAEVVVTGIRRSLIDSIYTKRDSSSIVEVVSAEDIGKLPDSSIAEAIARLPGLAAQRLDGRASKVSIRGFGENESDTTFNGREQVSIGDNRGVEFDLYPAEIMSGVVVYKTPNATMDAEGIAGVVDLRTVKPLSEERRFQVNAQYEKTGFKKLNPDGRDNGNRLNLSWVDQFKDDTVGVAFAYSKMKSPNQEQRWNSWGYPSFTYNGQSYSILGGAKPYLRSSILDRDTYMGIVQFKPNEDLDITLDGLYVDFSDHKILRGIEIPFAWGQGTIDPNTAVVDPATNFVTQATTVGQRVVVRNDYEERNAKLKNIGLNVDYHLNSTWSLNFDVSHSKVNREIFSMESYSGTGRGDNNGVPDTITYNLRPGGAGAVFTPGLDYSDPNLILLGGPLTWGWQTSLNQKYNIVGTPLENTAQDGFINAPKIDDALTELRAIATQQLDNKVFSNIKYGVSYRDRKKTKLSQGWFMTLNVFPNMLPVPSQYYLGSVDLGFIGMGNMLAYNSYQMEKDGYYDLTPETGAGHSTKSWTVNEKVTALFVSATIDSSIGDMPLKGNVGIRYLSTNQSSQGTALTAGVLTPTDIGETYSTVLPSLNLALSLTDSQKLRLGIAKTISRARMDEMNASVTADIGTIPDANGNLVTVSGGNALLRPKEAIGVDLTYENYFSPEGYFSLAYFWKDLRNWVFDGSEQVLASEYVLNPPTTYATANFKTNGGGGHLHGIEASVVFPFNQISEALDGFGVVASFTKITSNVHDHNGNDYRLPGLSDHITNATVYYDKHGFSVRASVRKRGSFKGDVYGLGFNTDQVDIEGETLVDAQIGYNFSESGNERLKNLSIYLQGTNLTNEPFHSTYGSYLKTRDYQNYGRTYLLGISYKL